VAERRSPRPPGDPASRETQETELSEAVPEETVSLAPLRARIDEIDREIVSLLNERAEIALEIGRRKQASGRRAIRDPLREQQVIEQVTRASAGLFPEPELVALYRTLIAATRKVQARDRARKREGTDRAE
jgi:chorismate mutase/prephenate dehydratase